VSSKWPRRLISNIDDSAQIRTERTNRRQRLETVSGGFVFFSSPGLTLMPRSVQQIARLEQDLLSRESSNHRSITSGVPSIILKTAVDALQELPAKIARNDAPMAAWGMATIGTSGGLSRTSARQQRAQPL
jgi:hypothetical protein